MRVVILDNAEQVAQFGEQVFRRQLQESGRSVLGLATGSTPQRLYKRLIEACAAGELTFREVRTFNLDEYLGLGGDHPQSYRTYMNRQLFDHIDVDRSNTFVPAGNAVDPYEACTAYEQAIEREGGIDLQLLGIGGNGHIGFNEPGSSLSSRTRIKTLTEQTIEANSVFFDEEEVQPRLSITMGVGTILDTRKVLLIATGEHKSNAVKAAIEGPVTASCPASVLQLHREAIFAIDNAAASKLELIDFYRHVEREKRALDSVLERP